MAMNMVANVRQALDGIAVARSYEWFDSMVALQWFLCGGEYKQLVVNQEHHYSTWCHVPTQENPADL